MGKTTAAPTEKIPNFRSTLTEKSSDLFQISHTASGGPAGITVPVPGHEIPFFVPYCWYGIIPGDIGHVPGSQN